MINSHDTDTLYRCIIYICVYIYIHTHTHMYTYIGISYICIYTCMREIVVSIGVISSDMVWVYLDALSTFLKKTFIKEIYKFGGMHINDKILVP